jgi:hypothetical protein
MADLPLLFERQNRIGKVLFSCWTARGTGSSRTTPAEFFCQKGLPDGARSAEVGRTLAKKLAHAPGGPNELGHKTPGFYPKTAKTKNANCGFYPNTGSKKGTPDILCFIRKLKKVRDAVKKKRYDPLIKDDPFDTAFFRRLPEQFTEMSIDII